MAEILEAEKKLIIKIVYYGPALSGKTTNLMQMHDLISPCGRGELMTLETKGDRTLFFDLLPIVAKTESGFSIKLKLFTVPGQVAHDATRKAVLSRTDGVVFVADSQLSQSVNNFESFENLEKNAERVGIEFDSLPLVIQFNKRDLKNIQSEEEIMSIWSPTGLSVRMASAIQGKGVAETFSAILSSTWIRLNQTMNLACDFGILERHFLSLVPDIDRSFP
ncbi:GTP-binding protein [Desulforegula conservatrix]|uniref:GTP-binding protein n=1 Tax=Desulforegula conservatrix TaxID=153026 RepID=UPI00040E6559|nr:ADP-ribosylation factor-like protein [Desulforegula conservatrix]